VIIIHEHSTFEGKIAIERLRSYKSLGIDQILAEFIQAGGKTLCSEINILINYFGIRKNLPEQWKESVIVPIFKER
jgi:hypothetical protein